MVAMVATLVDFILEILLGLLASVLLRNSISMPHPGSARLGRVVRALESAFDGDDELGDGVVRVLAIGDGEIDVGNGGGDVSLGGRSGDEAGVGHGRCLLVVGGGVLC